MKYFLLIGGISGWLIALIASLSAGSQFSAALLASAFGCLTGAVLLRIFHSVLHSSIRSHIEARAHALRAARESEDPSNQISS